MELKKKKWIQAFENKNLMVHHICRILNSVRILHVACSSRQKMDIVKFNQPSHIVMVWLGKYKFVPCLLDKLEVTISKLDAIMISTHCQVHFHHFIHASHAWLKYCDTHSEDIYSWIPWKLVPLMNKICMTISDGKQIYTSMIMIN